MQHMQHMQNMQYSSYLYTVQGVNTETTKYRVSTRKLLSTGGVPTDLLNSGILNPGSDSLSRGLVGSSEMDRFRGTLAHTCKQSISGVRIQHSAKLLFSFLSYRLGSAFNYRWSGKQKKRSSNEKEKDDPKPTLVNDPKPTLVNDPKPTLVNDPKPALEKDDPKPTLEKNDPKPTRETDDP